MEVYMGADHRGLELKDQLKDWLTSNGYTVHDMGAYEMAEDDDYPDIAVTVSKQVAENPTERRGILVCGSGVGVAVAANKIPGIRAALIHDTDIARVAQRDDNLNVLALGAQYIAPNRAQEVAEAFLTSTFSNEERHVRRLNKIADLEQRNS